MPIGTGLFLRRRRTEMLRRITLLFIIGLLIFAAYANATLVPVVAIGI